MKTKKLRQAKIVEIIKLNKVETQDELISLLSEQGIESTQATVCRDIKELHLLKLSCGDGSSVYSLPEQKHASAFDKKRSSFESFLRDSIIDSQTAMNLVVIRCHPGLASAVAASVDSIHLDEIIGTIAGDDTIFIATKNIDNAEAVNNYLLGIIQDPEY